MLRWQLDDVVHVNYERGSHPKLHDYFEETASVGFVPHSPNFELLKLLDRQPELTSPSPFMISQLLLTFISFFSLFRSLQSWDDIVTREWRYRRSTQLDGSIFEEECTIRYQLLCSAVKKRDELVVDLDGFSALSGALDKCSYTLGLRNVI